MRDVVPCATGCGKKLEPWELPRDRRDPALCFDCARAAAPVALGKIEKREEVEEWGQSGT